MAYIATADLKTYLGISNSNDDTILAACVTRAISLFDRRFSAKFEAETETRYFDAAAVDGYVLFLDKPLLSVTTLTNGNGVAIGSSGYWLLPRNTPPYWYIKLKPSSSVLWQFSTDGEISVAGTWGYSTTAPADVVQACLRLAAYLYRQKDSQVFETTAAPELGIMTIPAGIPNDVQTLIDALQAEFALA